MAVAHRARGDSVDRRKGNLMVSVTKCLVALAFVASSTIASAGQATPMGGPTAAQGVCKNDVDKLCKDVQPGEGRILECLKTHQKEVSPACATKMKQVKAELKKVSDACEPDIEKFCWDTPMGKGGIAKCLKSHQADLSADCKTAVAHAKKTGAAAKKAAQPAAAPPAAQPQ
jgi:hypothetical protein